MYLPCNHSHVTLPHSFRTLWNILKNKLQCWKSPKKIELLCGCAKQCFQTSNENFKDCNKIPLLMTKSPNVHSIIMMQLFDKNSWKFLYDNSLQLHKEPSNKKKSDKQNLNQKRIHNVSKCFSCHPKTLPTVSLTMQWSPLMCLDVED